MLKMVSKLLAVILCLSLLGCATAYNPATGKKEFILISTQEEIALGSDIHKQLKTQYKLSNDWKQTQRLGRVGQKVAAVSDRQDYEYHFYLIEKDDELNAFTTPGANIYVFSGLMDKLG